MARGLMDEKVAELSMLLRRCYWGDTIFEIGKSLGIKYFTKTGPYWNIDINQATLEIAKNVDDVQMLQISRRFRLIGAFRGKYYTVEDGRLKISGSWDVIRRNVRKSLIRWGENCYAVLKAIMNMGGYCSSYVELLNRIEKMLGRSYQPSLLMARLEGFGLIVKTGDRQSEWRIPEEIQPVIRQELKYFEENPIPSLDTRQAKVEVQRVLELEKDFSLYLNDLLKYRLKNVIRYGKKFSTTPIASYLSERFGELFFDCLLSVIQQYAVADADVVGADGRRKMGVGFNLALFGAPGTGKTFATCDLILGNPNKDVSPHGLPGRNRYCGGITPAMFMRIGQAYEGRKYNFVVPEFNDWFKYRGMVEPLKLAMERKDITYETVSERIGPYRFDSFFSVNYNTKVYEKGYEVTVSDPNFNAIEDRMICRLHKLTKSRFRLIMSSMLDLLRGKIDLSCDASQIRDHLTLTHAIEVGHPDVSDRFPYKPVVLTEGVINKVETAANTFLEYILSEAIAFSPRIVERTIQLACAMSMPRYFQRGDQIPVDDEALHWALRFFSEEAAIRSQEKVKSDEIFEEIIRRCDL